jgi:hypothetical protein
MKNLTATSPVEHSPERITVELVEWPYADDCGNNVETYDVTSWSPDDHREFRAFLAARGAVRCPVEIAG